MTIARFYPITKTRNWIVYLTMQAIRLALFKKAASYKIKCMLCRIREKYELYG